VPWVHYVPIQADFSDLVEKIKWLKQNDEKAKEISKNAVLFARFHFQEHEINNYLFARLQEYEKLYNYY
jgi:hypothetical protein